MKLRHLLTLLPLLAAQTALAGPISVQQAWARATPPGASNGAVYLTIRNSGAADSLIGASNSALAEKVEIHTHLNDNGVMRMRQVPQVAIPAKSTVAFQPHGNHVMLIGLKQPMGLGDKLPLTLRFKKAGEVKTEVTVGTIDAEGPAAKAAAGHEHMGHH